jgi:hypothetical protein
MQEETKVIDKRTTYSSIEIFWPYSEPMTDNDAVDVYVYMADGTKYVATFVTLSHVQNVMGKDKATGESAAGTYYWQSNMIIVKNLTEENVRKTIDDMIEQSYFNSAFSQCADVR